MPSHKHTGSTSNTGAHTHTLGRGGNTNTNTVIPQYLDTSHWLISSGTNVGVTASSGNHTHTVTLADTGGSSGHNNMPPYLTVYIWQRTA